MDYYFKRKLQVLYPPFVYFHPELAPLAPRLNLSIVTRICETILQVGAGKEISPSRLLLLYLHLDRHLVAFNSELDGIYFSICIWKVATSLR